VGPRSLSSLPRTLPVSPCPAHRAILGVLIAPAFFR
jgi:hypothetical protein